jgi:hypothetical protein
MCVEFIRVIGNNKKNRWNAYTDWALRISRKITEMLSVQGLQGFLSLLPNKSIIGNVLLLFFL